MPVRVHSALLQALLLSILVRKSPSALLFVHLQAAAATLAAVPVGAVGSALAPSIAVCPSGEEVLLASDSSACFLTPSGAPSRRCVLLFGECTVMWCMCCQGSKLYACSARVCG